MKHSGNPATLLPRRFNPPGTKDALRLAKQPLAIGFGTMALAVLPLHSAEHFWDEVPLSPSTTVPAVVRDDYWNSQYLRVNQEVAASDGCQLVFFGDSITWSWSLGPATGKEVWDECFSRYKPVNMGNSGDITPVMLHRVIRGNLDFPEGRHPKVAVLLCGINNFGVTQSDGGREKWDLGIDCPPDEIADGQRAIAQTFRRKLPGTRVILLGLLPVADPVKWEKCRRVNAIQAAVVRNSDEVTFMDLQEHFLLDDGTPDKALFTDGLHLSADGYRVWAAAIQPKIDAFIEAPPLKPVKILCLGGTLTEGADSKRSFRRHLDGMLRRKGHFIDFIGRRHKHHDDTIEPAWQDFDADHEGHPGRKLAWFAEKLPEMMVRNIPDLAVVEAGPDDNDADVERVILALREKNPAIAIVVMKSDPAGHSQPTGEHPASTAESPVSAVRIAVDTGGDDASPTAEGAQDIATLLAEAVTAMLSPDKIAE